MGKKVGECTPEQRLQIVEAGVRAGLKLYPFKANVRELARVRRALGFLRQSCPESLLDVGSRRGVFPMPFINEFPHVRVTALDLLEKRVRFLNELAGGGFGELRALQGDITQAPFADKSFDAVTMLEVLEHIPDAEKAVHEAVRLARRCIAVTVPSKPDSNPEHIHLLTKDRLTSMFASAGVSRLHFDGVEGHLFISATL